jgi:hypothetical protein
MHIRHDYGENGALGYGGMWHTGSVNDRLSGFYGRYITLIGVLTMKGV